MEYFNQVGNLYYVYRFHFSSLKKKKKSNGMNLKDLTCC